MIDEWLKPSTSILALLAIVALAGPTKCQGPAFGPQNIITDTADGAVGVHAADVDGDGDIDVLAASFSDGTVAWYENAGSGSFIGVHVIAVQQGAKRVRAADADGDGDVDVLAAYISDIFLYLNDGSGTAWSPTLIASQAAFHSVEDVRFEDLDGDGDLDVVSGSFGLSTAPKLSWHESLGNGLFAPPQIITTGNFAHPISAVDTADLNGDLLPDILVGSPWGGGWFRNLGGAFAPIEQLQIVNNAGGRADVYGADLDGDGDPDIAWAQPQSPGGGVVWVENLGSGSFAAQQAISTQGSVASDVHAVDVDSDGDTDLVSTSTADISWYANVGGGSFAAAELVSAQVIAGGVVPRIEVCAADVNGDGAMDLISASSGDDKVAWYANVFPPPCLSVTCLSANTPVPIGGTFNLWLQSPQSSAPAFVFLGTDTGSLPIFGPFGLAGTTQISFTSPWVAISDPSGLFGGSISPSSMTNASGAWMFSIPIPNDPALLSATFYSEAYILDFFVPLPPNLLFWQSNLLTINFQ